MRVASMAAGLGVFVMVCSGALRGMLGAPVIAVVNDSGATLAKIEVFESGSPDPAPIEIGRDLAPGARAEYLSTRIRGSPAS